PSKLNGDHRQSTVNRGTEEPTAEEFEVSGDDSLSQNQLTRSATDISLVSLPRLQWSREEAQSILATVPADEGLLALDFVESRATGASPKWARYQIVHFATNGFPNSKHRELSALVLSLVTQDGVPKNGSLGLHDIYNLNLPADLVVLSACQTALGKN